MSPIPLGILAGSAAPPISYEFIGSFEDVNTVPGLVTGIDIGSPGLVVIAAHIEVPYTINVVINGNSANIAVPTSYFDNNNATSGIAYYEILDTSIIDVQLVLDPSARPRRSAFGVWKINNYTNPVPQFTYVHEPPSFTDSYSVTTDVLTKKSVVIAGVSDGIALSPTGTATWTGINENYDTNTAEGGSEFSGASILSSSGAALTLGVTIDPANPNEDGKLSVAVWS